MEPGEQVIQIPVTVENFKPRKDRSWRLEFETRELTGGEVKLLADNYQGEGWLLFSPNHEVSVDSIPAAPADAGVKSPSERLRARIFIMWKQRGGKGDFETYYRTAIERLIEYIDGQIDH